MTRLLRRKGPILPALDRRSSRVVLPGAHRPRDQDSPIGKVCLTEKVALNGGEASCDRSEVRVLVECCAMMSKRAEVETEEIVEMLIDTWVHVMAQQVVIQMAEVESGSCSHVSALERKIVERTTVSAPATNRAKVQGDDSTRSCVLYSRLV